MHPITTRSADCKDCYRCLRVCPVKAISVKDGQAKVQEENCILCGKCVLECPQQAKLVKSEVYKVRDYLSSDTKVVLSIAPSFPAYFTGQDANEIFHKLKKLGFYAVEETSLGARYTQAAYKQAFEQNDGLVLSSCCPVIVNIIEIFFPELIPNLTPVASPAIAHGLSIKERLGWNTKVVFASPCIAKMTERGQAGKIDAVLTFAQLEELIKVVEAENDNLQQHNDVFKMETRLFPLPGGSIRSFIENYLLDSQVETITGLNDCWQTLKAIKNGKLNVKFIELLACRGGCVNGPIMDHSRSVVERRGDVLNYYDQFKSLPEQPLPQVTETLLKRTFNPKHYKQEKAPDQIIKQILAQIGKYSKEDEKNCGGCGYPTCREKAQAVYNGQAELEMCVSYMKTKAESTAHTIVNSTPNGIIVFDKNLKIKELNPAAKKFFQIYTLEVGGILSDFMDTNHFLQVINTGQPLKDYTVYYPELELYTRQIVVPIANSHANLYMAIIADITESEKKRQEMEQIKEEILSKANHVINNQMLVAQQIAGLLGETTAETKVTLLKLIEHFNQETERGRSCN